MPLPRLFERTAKPEITSRVKTIRSAQEKQVTDAVEAGLYPARVASRKGVKLAQFALLSLVVSLLLVILVTVSGALEPLRQYLRPLQGDVGGIIVSSEYVKVHVKLDGKELGISPYNGQNIPTGQHRLQVEAVDNMNAFWAATEIPVVITKGNTTVISINPAPAEPMVNYTMVTPLSRSTATDPSLVVKTIPAQAEVLIDDISKGIAPVVLTDLEEGTHKVTVQAQGYKPTTIEVSLSSEKTVTVEVRLYQYQVNMQSK